MKCVLVGMNDINFKNGEDEVNGVKLHFLSPDSNTVGHMACSQFLRRDFFNSFGYKFSELKELLGTEVNIEFNTKGKICTFVV